MKIHSKTNTFRLLTAAPSLLASRSLLGALFVLASMLQLPAQNAVLTGAIGGRVTDQERAVVPGVSVVLRNLATGLQQSAVTNHAGLYQFLALMPGTYSVTATGKPYRAVTGTAHSGGASHSSGLPGSSHRAPTHARRAATIRRTQGEGRSEERRVGKECR